MPPTERNEAAEKALKERQRQYARYQRQKHAHRRELYEREPRLRSFALQLQRFGASDAVSFLRYVREESHGWLCTAPPELRAEALSLVDERIMRLRMKEGMLPLDDPLPGEEDDVWQLAKRELT